MSALPGNEHITAQGKLKTPTHRTRADYQGTLIAPYRRFQPRRRFYANLAPGGTYTADIMKCPWHCEGCWSLRGWDEEPVNYELDPPQAVAKLIEGMQRNLMSGSRISGGDAGYWWDHVRALISLWIEETTDMRIKVPGERRTQEPLLVIETSGGITISPSKLGELEKAHGEQMSRVWYSVGMKATSPELLSKLTGMPLAAAAAAHERQIKLARHIATELKHTGVLVSFLKPYTEPERFEEIRAEIDGALGAGPRAPSVVAVLPYTGYRSKNK